MPFDDRVNLVGPLESKGLEWDAVIVVAVDEIAALYTAGVGYVTLTRATQRLVRLDVN